MSRLKFSFFLHRYRFLISFLFLLTIVYFQLFTWLTLPPVTTVLGWQPDITLTVLPDVENAYISTLQPGDEVLVIDGRAVKRGDLLFLPPVKSEYQFIIKRDGDTLDQTVRMTTGDLFQVLTLSTAILSLAFWGIGFLTVWFARSWQKDALFIGLSWEMIGSGIASPGPYQTGAPGAWLVGGVLIFIFPVILIFLAFVPQQKPHLRSSQILLWGFGIIAGLMSVLSAIESLWLFPSTSWQSLIGIRITDMLTVLTGVSVILTVVILLLRSFQSQPHSYERQQLNILFFCMALALLPLFVFVILPAGQYMFVPYPLVYSLLLLVPAGYFFVLHRQGYLELDGMFSRLITILILILSVGMAYATGAFLLDRVFHWDIQAAGQGGFVLVVLSVLASGQKKVQSFIDLLIYGREQIGPKTILDVKSRLSANPEPATVTDVVEQTAAHLAVNQTAVLVRQKDSYIALTGDCRAIDEEIDNFSQVRLRARDPDNFTTLPAWAELTIPITARGDMLGLLILSRPGNGHFNARQVAVLQEVADILAFGLLVINLVESMNAISRQTLYEKELQRQQIATEIHNEPLHTLGLVIMQLHQASSLEAIPEAAQAIRQVSQDLRRIIAGLRPAALKESVDWMIQQVMREFAENYPTIDVRSEMAIHSKQRAAEPTKLACYYILTEALNNIIKHAQATVVTVSLTYKPHEMHLHICDNGIGGQLAMRPLTELLRYQHIGVADMHRWALIGGGELQIEPNTPSGTQVNLTLPLTPAESSIL